MEGGFISGCTFRGRGREELSISHLLFVDDMIVLCEASGDQLLYLSWVLFWFEVSSGLKINLDKSELNLVGEVDNASALAAKLECKTGSLPSTYLCLPLGANHKSVVVWDSIEEQLCKRLALWKCNYISKGGRLTLMKSTLAGLPLYNVFVNNVVSCAKRLDKVQRLSLGGRDT